MKRLLSKDIQFFRVWPDGTVQDIDEAPCEWRSDDFTLVEADSEEEALALFLVSEHNMCAGSC